MLFLWSHCSIQQLRLKQSAGCIELGRKRGH
ncbi:hypothetical protein NC653_041349 [Populus alba x Populus x berolinensis]|uniref:Uncharacterized protein n=1 Tax=Populus alba x Populus x berolinensis TaxID=444605 RepID=A0AAD6PQM4_9ROSI|nr:hypothetical protein NC653_041349 [Populus alba x Populus x berolinensis]